MFEQYYQFNKTAGISIVLNADGTFKIDYCEIRITNNKLEFCAKKTGLTYLSQLAKISPERKHYALNLFGKGILQKKVNKTNVINDKTFDIIFPNANFNDFYIQNFVSGNYSFVTIIRKSEADKWIKQLLEIGIPVIILSLGVYVVNSVIPQLNNYGEALEFDGNRIIFNDENNWESVNYDINAISPFQLKIDIEPIDPKLLIAYSAAYQLSRVNKAEIIKADNLNVDLLYDNNLAVKKQRMIILFFLGIILFLAFLSFLSISHFSSENLYLSEQLDQSEQSEVNTDKLRQQITFNENVLSELGWNRGISINKYVSDLAKISTSNLVWQEVDINPININLSRTQKILVFEDRQIVVSGLSVTIVPVNDWISKVKQLEWVKNIELDNYSFNNDVNTGMFKVVIKY